MTPDGAYSYTRSSPNRGDEDSFKYRVTDSSSESAIGTAAVFVGVEPFGVVFAGDRFEIARVAADPACVPTTLPLRSAGSLSESSPLRLTKAKDASAIGKESR